MIEVTGFKTKKKYNLNHRMISSMIEGSKKGKTYTLLYMLEDFKGPEDYKIFQVRESASKIRKRIEKLEQ